MSKKSVPKIGIYVPECRVSDVDEYRDRMNFSAVFWSAFDQEAERIQGLEKRDKMFRLLPFHGDRTGVVS